MTKRPPKLNIEKLRSAKETSTELEALRARLRQFEDARKIERMPTTFIALEAMASIIGGAERGYSAAEMASTFPDEWGDQSLLVPACFLFALRDCWLKYKDKGYLTMGEAFGLESAHGQGSGSVKSKLATADKHRKYAQLVCTEFYAQNDPKKLMSLNKIYELIADNESVSTDTIKKAYYKYGPEISKGLKAKGIIPIEE